MTVLLMFWCLFMGKAYYNRAMNVISVGRRHERAALRDNIGVGTPNPPRHQVQSYPCAVSIASAKFGNGLYIEVTNESKAIITLPKLTYITDYYPGEFSSANTFMPEKEDKYGYAVSYSINSPDKLVMYNGRIDSIGKIILADRQQDGDQNLSNILEGHKVSLGTNGQLKIQPKLFYDKKTFYPREVDNEVNFGMYANDLAFEVGNTNEEQYEERHEKNCLRLIWRMGKNEQDTYYPIMPVVITTRDLTLNNNEPIEIGLSYGYQYWNSWMLKQKVVAVARKIFA